MSYTVSCPSCSTSFPVDPMKVPEEGVLAQCSMCPEVFEVTRPDEAELAAPSEADPEDAVAPAEIEVEEQAAPEMEVEAEAAPEPVIDEEAPVAEVAADPEEMAFETSEGFAPMDAAAVDQAVEEHLDEFGGREITFDEPLATEEAEEEAAPTAEVEVEEAPAPEAEPELAVAEAAPAAEPEPEAPADAPAPAAIQFGRRDPSDKAKSLARSLVSDIIAYHKDKHSQSLAAGTLVQDFEEEIEKSWKEYTEQVEGDVVANNSFFNDALNEILAEGQSVFTLEG